MASRKAYMMVLSGILMASSISVIWLVLLVRGAYDPPRAITPGEHALCATMPRGSQVLENNRLACFNDLYGTGRFESL